MAETKTPAEQKTTEAEQAKLADSKRAQDDRDKKDRVSRAYAKWREAQVSGDRRRLEEAEKEVRDAQGGDEGVGDYVLHTADGKSHRVANPNATSYNGSPVVGTFHDPR